MSELGPTELKKRVFNILKTLGHDDEKTAIAGGRIIAGAVLRQQFAGQTREWMEDQALREAEDQAGYRR